jgi:hypothetical protein
MLGIFELVQLVYYRMLGLKPLSLQILNCQHCCLILWLENRRFLL